MSVPKMTAVITEKHVALIESWITVLSDEIKQSTEYRLGATSDEAREGHANDAASASAERDGYREILAVLRPLASLESTVVPTAEIEEVRAAVEGIQVREDGTSAMEIMHSWLTQEKKP